MLFTLLITAVWMVILVMVLRYSINATLDAYMLNSVETNTNIINNVFHNIEDDAYLVTEEYALWEEHADALLGRNLKWVNENVVRYIADEELYDLDYYYIYGNDHELIFTNDVSNRFEKFYDEYAQESFNGYIVDDVLYHIVVAPIQSDYNDNVAGKMIIMTEINTEVVLDYYDPFLNSELLGIEVESEVRVNTNLRIDDVVDFDLHKIINIENEGEVVYTFTYSFEKHHKEAEKLFFRIHFLVLIMILVIVVSLINVLSMIIKRLALMIKDIDLVANGHYDYKIEGYNSFEFNELSQHINQLSNEVKVQIGALQTANFDAISTLVNAVEAKDAYTSGHSNRVMAYSLVIAQDLPTVRKDVLRTAALLHDIGKIGIPHAILNKLDPLTTDEYDLIKDHSLRGYEILRESLHLSEVRKIVLQHHERPDGKGYPTGLYLEDIEFEALILSVADTFDAIVSDRPYRVGRSFEVAIEILKEVSGTQLDEQVVRIFLNKLDEVKKVMKS